MLDKYKEALEEIEVPRELVQATSQRMQQLQLQLQQEQQQQQQQQMRQPHPRHALTFRRAMPLAAACLAVLLVSAIVVIVMFADQEFILTPLEDGVHIEQVELADGNLIFRSENRRFVAVPHFAHPDAQESGHSMEMLEFEDGGQLFVIMTENRLPPNADPLREENSEINGNPLAVGVYDGFGIYWAQFMLDGTGHHIQGENMTQEAFIRLLHDFFD